MSYRDSMDALAESWVNVNGEFVEGRDATVSIWDRGFVYGDAVFEGVFVLEGRVLKLDEHVDRLFDSARYLDITVPVSKNTLRSRILETVRRNGFTEGYVRPKVSRGEGPLGVSNTALVNEHSTANVFVIPQPFKSTALPSVVTETGRVVGTRQRSPGTLDPRAKVDNYLPNILAEMAVNGTDDDVAILLDDDGYVAEANTANIFVVSDGELQTPPPQTALAGITRRAVLDIADDAGIPTAVQRLTTYDLYTADEVFVTGTSAGIVGLTAVDGRQIDDGAVGPLTERLAQHLYDHLVETGTPIDA
jgi:branched-chain amino acid aminotransferase